VKRERNVEDRRFISVNLTGDGRKLIERIFPAHVQSIVDIFGSLSAPEQEELGRLAKQLGRSVVGQSAEPE
jgi:MarR family 2-MHQ and catechol resistance regulon transcriptional repressor